MTACFASASLLPAAALMTNCSGDAGSTSGQTSMGRSRQPVTNDLNRGAASHRRRRARTPHVRRQARRTAELLERNDVEREFACGLSPPITASPSARGSLRWLRIDPAQFTTGGDQRRATVLAKRVRTVRVYQHPHVDPAPAIGRGAPARAAPLRRGSAAPASHAAAACGGVRGSCAGCAEPCRKRLVPNGTGRRPRRCRRSRCRR